MLNNYFSFTYLFDLLGVAVFAISGTLSAGKKQLDFLGVVVLSVVTAIGGGTIRDLLLNRFPIFWISDPSYLMVIIAASIFTLAYVKMRKPPGKALLVADAFGLAFFTITGTKIAEVVQLSPVIIVMMGTITGVAGGIIRDILTAEIPLVLRRDIYATAAITGSITYLICKQIGATQLTSDWIGFGVIVLIRVAAIIWHLRLPQFRLTGKTDSTIDSQ